MGIVTRSTTELHIDIPISNYIMKNYDITVIYIGVVGVMDYTSSYATKFIKTNNGIRFNLQLTESNKVYVGYTALARLTFDKKAITKNSDYSAR